VARLAADVERLRWAFNDIVLVLIIKGIENSPVESPAPVGDSPAGATHTGPRCAYRMPRDGLEAGRRALLHTADCITLAWLQLTGS
jgi:hypothetical protein